MSRLLVSVRNADEALDAAAGGADLIDIKEPARGALGAAAPAIWAEVKRAAPENMPLSVALGELLVDPVEQAAREAAGFQFAKTGLAGCGACCDWRDRWAQVVQRLPDDVGAVAVIYADYRDAGAPHRDEILVQAQRIGCRAVLVDTYRKSNGDVFSYFSDTALAELVAAVRAAGMLTVLGGSLCLETVAKAAALGPDFIAVRGAACTGDRLGKVRRGRVAQLAKRVAACGRQITQRRTASPECSSSSARTRFNVR